MCRPTWEGGGKEREGGGYYTASGNVCSEVREGKRKGTRRGEKGERKEESACEIEGSF
jgi:hypothetical protein